jgi:hypothetical protein
VGNGYVCKSYIIKDINRFKAIKKAKQRFLREFKDGNKIDFKLGNTNITLNIID